MNNGTITPFRRIRSRLRRVGVDPRPGSFEELLDAVTAYPDRYFIEEYRGELEEQPYLSFDDSNERVAFTKNVKFAPYGVAAGWIEEVQIGERSRCARFKHFGVTMDFRWRGKSYDLRGRGVALAMVSGFLGELVRIYGIQTARFDAEAGRGQGNYHHFLEHRLGAKPDTVDPDVYWWSLTS